VSDVLSSMKQDILHTNTGRSLRQFYLQWNYFFVEVEQTKINEKRVD
jgi:hypothetical protein